MPSGNRTSARGSLALSLSKRLHTVAEIAQTAGVHRTTVYDYLNKEG